MIWILIAIGWRRAKGNSKLIRKVTNLRNRQIQRIKLSKQISNWALLVRGFKRRILSKISDKRSKMPWLRRLRSHERSSRRINLSTASKMTLACVSLCISLGHLFLSMASKGSRAGNGTTSTEVHSGSRRPRRSQAKRKLIIWKSNISNSIVLCSEMTCLSSQTGTSLAALWAVWISSMSFLSKNTKIQFQSSSKNPLRPHSSSSSGILAL